MTWIISLCFKRLIMMFVNKWDNYDWFTFQKNLKRILGWNIAKFRKKSILNIMSNTFIHMNIAMCPIPPYDDIINNVIHTHIHTHRMIDGQTVIHMYGRTGPNQYPPLLMKTGDNIYFNCGYFNSGCSVIFLFKFIPNLKL